MSPKRQWEIKRAKIRCQPPRRICADHLVRQMTLQLLPISTAAASADAEQAILFLYSLTIDREALHDWKGQLLGLCWGPELEGPTGGTRLCTLTDKFKQQREALLGLLKTETCSNLERKSKVSFLGECYSSSPWLYLHNVQQFCCLNFLREWRRRTWGGWGRALFFYSQIGRGGSKAEKWDRKVSISVFFSWLASLLNATILNLPEKGEKSKLSVIFVYNRHNSKGNILLFKNIFYKS